MKCKFFFSLNLLFFLFTTTSLHGDSLSSVVRKVWAHLLIKDEERAYLEAKRCFLDYPDSQLAFETYINCVAVSEDERFWYQEWKKYKEAYPEVAYEAKLLEKVSWELLGRAKKSSSGQVRHLGLIAAGLTRDIRTIPVIIEGLKDANASIRELAVELCALYGDSPLKKALIAAYKVEKIRKVRASMIRCFGKLQMREMREPLLLSLEGGRISTEEQYAVVEMLVHLTQGITHEELERLVTSKRSVLRILATEVIVKCNLEDKGDLLFTLLKDPHPTVSACAMKALGLLRIERVQGKPMVEWLGPYLNSTIAPVAITASWLAKLHGDVRGDKVLAYWIREGDSESRVLAAGAIAALGSYGVDLAFSLVEKIEDPFVRLNLALALLGQREHLSLACTICEDLLLNNKEKWMAESLLGGLFSPLKKSHLTHQRGIPHYPELVSQVIKLQILSLLAVVEHEGAKEIVKDFLKNKNWQVTGLAAELLLEDGDEETLLCIHELLEDGDPLIALEAAIVLAVLGRDHEAIPYLLRGYEGAKLETKVKILEAISRIKDKSVIPFLVECLDEPSHLLRIIAASVLLQTMNN